MLEMVNWSSRRFLHIQNDICYYIDILDNGTDFEAWITREDYGVSSVMFGMPKQQGEDILNFDDFRKLVEANLEEYVEGYEEDYPEEEGTLSEVGKGGVKVNTNLKDFLEAHEGDYICISDMYSGREDILRGSEWLHRYDNAEDYTVTYIGEGGDSYDYYISIE